MRLFPSDKKTIAGTAQALRGGQTTCVDVLEACLQRTEQQEPKVRAWVLLDRDGALQRARQLDADLSQGCDRGPLHGIPVGIKDIVDVAGLPTAAGSKRMPQQTAAQDAPLVTRMRDAGAVILGKTVTTQYAAFDPAETRNPWNLQRTPGGSSSGSAAAVAAGMCLAAIGTQTGGSITRPAAFCGIAACKPSFGIVSTEGVFPFAPSLDHAGPLARCVEDVALVQGVIASAPGDWVDLDAATNLPPRLGRLRGLFEERAEPCMQRAMHNALGQFSANGASVIDVPLPSWFDDLHRLHRIIMCAEAAACHRERFSRHADDYQPAIRSIIDEGLELRAVDYFRARQHQQRARREATGFFEQADVLVCPAAPGPAPDVSTTGDPVFNSPWTYTGLPTVCFPVGLSQEDLPLGIQLVGKIRGEAELFRAARWCEQMIRESLGSRSAAGED